MVDRVKGPDRQTGEPVRAQALKTRLRAWQISPEALENNPHWLQRGHVARNGRLWGEAEDPVDEVRDLKGKRKMTAPPPKMMRVEGVMDVAAARARRDALVSDIDLDELFS